MRYRRPSRAQPTRAIKPQVIVVTEGEKTEPQYIEEFSRIHGAANVHVVGTGYDPRRVVERAIDIKRSVIRRTEDRVWAVFDRDDHQRFKEALDLARQHGIHVALSNPCFELWAVFHYQDHAAYIKSHACQRLLGNLCKGYRSSRGKLFNDTDVIRCCHEDAVRRGKQSLRDRRREGNPNGNPSTSMHLLMESIRTQ